MEDVSVVSVVPGGSVAYDNLETLERRARAIGDLLDVLRKLQRIEADYERERTALLGWKGRLESRLGVVPAPVVSGVVGFVKPSGSGKVSRTEERRLRCSRYNAVLDFFKTKGLGRYQEVCSVIRENEPGLTDKQYENRADYILSLLARRGRVTRLGSGLYRSVP